MNLEVIEIAYLLKVPVSFSFGIAISMYKNFGVQKFSNIGFAALAFLRKPKVQKNTAFFDF